MRPRAFTLLEILLVIALVAFLAFLGIVAINPTKHFAEIRDRQRQSDLTSIAHAFTEYITSNKGITYPGIDSTLKMIGTASTGCQTICSALSDSGQSQYQVTHNSGLQFATGTFTNTLFNTSRQTVELSSSGLTAKSGNYVSEIIDAGENVIIDSVSWMQFSPSGRRLPGGNSIETAYSEDNANMVGTILHTHLESAGTITDTSGNNNTGNVYAATLTGGIYDNAVQFSGLSGSYASVANSSVLNPASAISIELWVKWVGNPSTTGGWANIVSKGGEDQYQIQHNYANNQFEFALRTNVSRRFVLGTSGIIVGKWYHVVATYDGARMRIYVDGVLNNAISHSGTISSSTSNIDFGRRSVSNDRYFPGAIDEVAIYNRALSDAEVLSRYKRGSSKIKLQIRGCTDSSCTSSTFIGPDGTSSTYFETTASNGTVIHTNSTISARYWQYKVNFETDNSTVNPKLGSVNLKGTFSSATTLLTEDSCLDLSSLIVDDYTPFIPKDPRFGSVERTQYAVTKTPSGLIRIYACKPESREIILQYVK